MGLAPISPPMTSLFAYGTLLVPRIWLGVVGRDFPSCPANLPGFAIFRVENADFPGIIPANPEDLVPGRLFTGLDDTVIARLDAYEDNFYDRRGVTLLDAGGNPVLSQAYVVADAFRGALSDDRWTLDWFEKNALERYARRHGF